MIALFLQFAGLLFKLLSAPFRLMSPRIGCLILILIAVVLFVSCGMLGRLFLVI